MPRWTKLLFLIILALPTVSAGASRCLQHLAANVFPQFRYAIAGFRQSIPYQGQTLLFGAGQGIFVWQEEDQLFVASKSGQLLGIMRMPFEMRSIVVLPNLAATLGDESGIPMHLIGAAGANRLVVYQFDPSESFDLRIAALDFFEPGFYPQRVEARFASLPDVPVQVPEFSLFGKDGEQADLYLRANRLK